LRLSFALPGAHRVNRGAEVAIESIAQEIALLGFDDVTVLGSGPEVEGRAYAYRRFGLIPREKFERFPKFPPFRTEYVYEEVTWVTNVVRGYRPSSADLTVTCSYPFVNWLLTRSIGRTRPPHVFVTQNGDWPSYSNHFEYRPFRCDGLVCTNPLYQDRNQGSWNSVLIPNGIDPSRFSPGPAARETLGLPVDAVIVLMVSALVESKRVLEGLRALSSIPDIHVVVAGDGPLRAEFDKLAAELMPGRVTRMVLRADQMPDLYRSVDVFLHPTFWESFGNVYVEAMAVGVPVVAHDYEVTRWIFGECAGLVDASDDRALAAAVEQAITDGRSDAISRTSVAAERFAWSTIARHYRRFFAEVVERHGGLTV
jgi:glycosyltransferase involved in cell wall biosynthesis